MLKRDAVLYTALLAVALVAMIVAFNSGTSLDEIKVRRESEPWGSGFMRTVVVGGCAGIVIGIAASLLVQILS